MRGALRRTGATAGGADALSLSRLPARATRRSAAVPMTRRASPTRRFGGVHRRWCRPNPIRLQAQM